MKKLHLLSLALFSLIAVAGSAESAHAQFLYVSIDSLCEEGRSAIDLKSLPDFKIKGLSSSQGPFREARCIVESRNYRGKPLLGPRSLRGRVSIDFSITVSDDDGRRGDDTVDVNPVAGRRNLRLRLSRRGSSWDLRNRDTGEIYPLALSIADEDRSRSIEIAGEPTARKRARLRFRVWVQAARF